MDLSLSFSIFGKKTFVMGGEAAVPTEDKLAHCAAHGQRLVELVMMRGYLEPGDWAAIKQVGAWAQQHGVTIHSVHGPSGSPGRQTWLADPDEQARQRAVQERRLAIEGARRLGARYLVVEFEVYDRWPMWPHLQPPQALYADSLARWRRSFHELLDYAVQVGLPLAIENVDGTPLEELAALMEGLSREQVGICFDSSHATYGGDWLRQLQLLAPYVIVTHLSDNDALPGAAWTDRHWRPFEGVIDWPRLLHELVQHSPCQCLTCEILDREQPWITEPLLQSLARLKALLP